MRTLISSLESDSKRSTLESSSTSSSSRIVGCSSLICANPLCFSRTLFSQAYQRESFVAGRDRVEHVHDLGCLSRRAFARHARESNREPIPDDVGLDLE